jgi:hypothetical protein
MLYAGWEQGPHVVHSVSKSRMIVDEVTPTSRGKGIQQLLSLGADDATWEQFQLDENMG